MVKVRPRGARVQHAQVGRPFDAHKGEGPAPVVAIDLKLGEVEFLGGSSIVDLQGGAGLSVLGYLDTRLSFGIDLDDPQSIYLFDEATGIIGAIKAQADNLVFNAAIGPMGVFIRDGSAEINVEFGMDSGDIDPDSDEIDPYIGPRIRAMFGDEEEQSASASLH